MTADRYRVYGYEFGFTSPSSVARERLAALYRGFAARGRFTDEPLFVLDRRSEVAGLWELSLTGRVLLQVDSLGQALDATESEIVRRIVDSRPDLIWIHAATVAAAGGAALIGGVSGAGKSTLSLSLALRGLQVWTDDASLLDPRTQEARALPRCFHLDPRSRDLLQQAGLRIPSGCHGFITPNDLGANPVTPSTIRVIVILEPERESTTPKLEPLTQAEAAVRLVEHVYQREHEMPELLNALGYLASAATCYRLVRGGVAETADVVESLLASPTPERR